MNRITVFAIEAFLYFLCIDAIIISHHYDLIKKDLIDESNMGSIPSCVIHRYYRCFGGFIIFIRIGKSQKPIYFTHCILWPHIYDDSFLSANEKEIR